ncbi:rhomboid family intramembrane serine protease [Halobaculum sp. MBLA0147]|uniref:rhomboid family intramembrane serine protease n=1 Tax=Halobaculum sp. MBLA0147 TaxID=3079934 RepID=UPI0035257B8A
MVGVVGQVPPVAQRGALLVAVVLAVVVGVALERRSGRRPLARVRRRLLFGVPWGTITAAAFVVAVYLFVQGGWSNWYDPVVVPFRAWSYFAPTGVAVAAFGHANPSHLLGNLVGTVTVAPLVEYVWGHYPRERGAHSFDGYARNPYVRAFVLFPAAVVAVGVATAVFSLGPVIGFSGVVFAFVGFALVYYPLGTVVALSAGSVVRLAYRALRDPSLTASGRSAFVTPWWADIAIQGHAFGLLLGVVAAGALAQRRTSGLPSPGRLLVGAVLVGVAQNLWAVYWFLGGGEYVLFRAVGLSLVVVLAVLVAAVAVDDTEDDGSVESDRDERDPDETGPSPTTSGSTPDPTTTRADGGDDRERAAPDHGDSTTGDDEASGTSEQTPGLLVGLDATTVRTLSVTLLVMVLAVLAGVAVPTNMLAVDDEPLPGEPVEVRGYTVTYAEDVENGMVSVVDVAAFGLSTSVNTSGVIVRNPDRNVWTTAVPRDRLAFGGRQTVVLGGVGWRETVAVDRRGYSAAGGGTAYTVSLVHDGERRRVFRSEPARAEPRVAGWNVSVVAAERGFALALSDGNETLATPIPEGNESATLGGVTFVRDGRAVFALVGSDGNQTRVRVAARERYRGQSDR